MLNMVLEKWKKILHGYAKRGEYQNRKRMGL